MQNLLDSPIISDVVLKALGALSVAFNAPYRGLVRPVNVCSLGWGASRMVALLFLAPDVVIFIFQHVWLILLGSLDIQRSRPCIWALAYTLVDPRPRFSP